MLAQSHTISNRIKNDFPTCDALPPIPLVWLSRHSLKRAAGWSPRWMPTVAALAASRKRRSAARLAVNRRAVDLFGVPRKLTDIGTPTFEM